MQAGAAKLVRVPLGVKGSWLRGFKVHAIDRSKTTLSVVVLKAILPKDLLKEVRVQL